MIKLFLYDMFYFRGYNLNYAISTIYGKDRVDELVLRFNSENEKSDFWWEFFIDVCSLYPVKIGQYTMESNEVYPLLHIVETRVDLSVDDLGNLFSGILLPSTTYMHEFNSLDTFERFILDNVPFEEYEYRFIPNVIKTPNNCSVYWERGSMFYVDGDLHRVLHTVYSSYVICEPLDYNISNLYLLKLPSNLPRIGSGIENIYITPYILSELTFVDLSTYISKDNHITYEISAINDIEQNHLYTYTNKVLKLTLNLSLNTHTNEIQYVQVTYINLADITAEHVDVFGKSVKVSLTQLDTILEPFNLKSQLKTLL